MVTTFNWESNIRAVFALATPTDYRKGLDWYALARRIAQSISADSGIALDAIAATISALSPRNKWARNVIDARNFAIAAVNNLPEPKACTFIPNRAKAWAIVNGGSWRDILAGIKVESFVANILGDYSRVTVDVWAMRVATLGLGSDSPKNEAEYRAIEIAYQNVAVELGLAPAELQAITWTVVERMLKGVKDDKGMKNGTAKRNAILVNAIEGNN